MRIAMTKEAFNRKISLLTSKLNLNSGRNWLGVMFEAVWFRDLYTMKLEQKYLESFEIRCWRRIEKIKWSEKGTKEEVLE
jgi:hypothetical protein